MQARDQFQVTVTFCFTPDHLGMQPHHTSPPWRIEAFAEFCARRVRRYADGSHTFIDGMQTRGAKRATSGW